jgi:UDP-N-acetylmuramoyl-tripeptide--D-alanyl-D-alanine ligase
MSRHAATGFGDTSGFYEDREQLIKRLKQSLNKDSTVLVKGSRSMGMEQIVNALIADSKRQEIH